MSEHHLHGLLATPRPSDLQGDADPQETAEWHDALVSLVQRAGPARARYVLDRLAQWSRTLGVGWTAPQGTPYVNTIAVHAQPPFPGDLAIEERLAAMTRWNA